jgi:hypothetical protein
MLAPLIVLALATVPSPNRNRPFNHVIDVMVFLIRSRSMMLTNHYGARPKLR